MRTPAYHPGTMRYLALTLVISLCVLVPVSPTHMRQTIAGTTTKLSAITVTNGTGIALKAAGDYIVFLADYDAPGHFDLYSAPVAGGPVTCLTGGLARRPGSDFYITATGRVVFKAVEGSYLDAVPYLYSVPLTGGEPTLLGPTYQFSPSSYVDLRFAISPDGTRVVYIVDVVRQGVAEVFSVPSAGGSTVRLSPALPDPLPDPFVGAGTFQMSPDGQRVVFTTYDVVSGVGALQVASIGGETEPIVLARGRFSRYTIAPDSSRVAYSLEDSVIGSISTLHSIALNGGSPADLAVSGSELTFSFTPDSQRLVYHTSEYASASATLGSIDATDGTSPVQIATSATGFGSGYLHFVLAPDGQSIFYIRSSAMGLFRRAVMGGPEIIAHGSTSAHLASLTFSADGQYALFKGSYPQNIYSYPLDGGQSSLIAEDVSFPFLLMPSGHGIIYTRFASGTPPNFDNAPSIVYAASAAGGSPIALARDIGPGEDQLLALDVSFGGLVFFASGSADVSPTPYNHIYAIPFDGSAAPRLVDKSATIVGDVIGFAVSAIDGRAVYIADQDTDEVPELYSVPLTGGTPIQLNTRGEAVSTFSISPAGGRVFYAARLASNAPILASVPIGGGPATPISTQGNLFLFQHAFTPDGSQIIFSTSMSGMGSDGLYRVPAAGGAAQLIDREGGGFSISPDSAYVVYTAPYYVISAPLDGGPSVGLGRGIWTPAISPDSATVIFMRMGEDIGRPEDLVAVPITGGEPAILFPASDYYELGVITPDSKRVLVTTYKKTDAGETAILTLRSLPLSGGAPVTLAEVQGEMFSRFGCSFQVRVAAGGQRVVYRVRSPDTDGTTPVALVSDTVTGGANTVLTTFNGVTNETTPVDIPFTLSPNGSHVLFLRSGVLYRAPARGGTLEKLSAGSPVGQFDFAEDGSVLFVEDGQLFQAPVGAAPVRLDALPATTSVLHFAQAQGFVVFTAVTGAQPTIEGSGITELYATRLIPSPLDDSSTIFLPLVRR